MTGESKGGWDRVNTERKNNLTYPAASHGSDRPVHVMYPQPETLVDPCLIRDDQLPSDSSNKTTTGGVFKRRSSRSAGVSAWESCEW